MHVEWMTAILKTYIVQIFTDNIVIKFILGSFTGVLWAMYTNNEIMIKLIFVLYIADFILWFLNALQKREVSSAKLFKWGFKFIVYWLLLLVSYSVDKAFYSGNMFTNLMIAFIICTDWISILENLKLLWYEPPLFFMKYLKALKKGIEKKIDIDIIWENLSNNKKDE